MQSTFGLDCFFCMRILIRFFGVSVALGLDRDRSIQPPNTGQHPSAMYVSATHTDTSIHPNRRP